jgi:hypothetical protein
VIEQGETAEGVFDAVNGTIDSITTTAVFSHCKPNPCRETAEEQRHTNNNFICSRGRNLRPLNNGFVLARWVSLFPGTDVKRTYLLGTAAPGRFHGPCQWRIDCGGFKVCFRVWICPGGGLALQAVFVRIDGHKEYRAVRCQPGGLALQDYPSVRWLRPGPSTVAAPS